MFSGSLGLKWRFWGQTKGRDGAIATPNEVVFTFEGSYVCAKFAENRSRNATVRVPTDGYTYTLTDANQFYNLSHAVCYSYGTDNNNKHCCKNYNTLYSIWNSFPSFWDHLSVDFSESLKNHKFDDLHTATPAGLKKGLALTSFDWMTEFADTLSLAVRP